MPKVFTIVLISLLAGLLAIIVWTTIPLLINVDGVKISDGEKETYVSDKEITEAVTAESEIQKPDHRLNSQPNSNEAKFVENDAIKKLLDLGYVGEYELSLVQTATSSVWFTRLDKRDETKNDDCRPRKDGYVFWVVTEFRMDEQTGAVEISEKCEFKAVIST